MIFNKKEKNEAVIQEEDSSLNDWLEADQVEAEGQLAIDVFHDDKKIVIKSTIAGADPDDLKISLHNDLLMIKGRRDIDENVPEENYLFKECHWGPFSRSIILPAEVDTKRVEAEIENGILTITLYKTKPEKIEIKVKD
ncbi:MAG: Hsp20/alpha crystallin family protein [Patescibacteria group bacterium]|jgi:HSP20 family protein|nr:Hsp20/alpha crystallin family protein [bacterium]HQC50059.1 Hsp20/alpha crystallin family protein [bacterium]